MLLAVIFLALSLVLLYVNLKISGSWLYPATIFCAIWTVVALSYIIFLSTKKNTIYELDLNTLAILGLGEILFSLFGSVATILKDSKQDLEKTEYQIKYSFDVFLLAILIVLFPFYLNAVNNIVEGSKFAKVNFYLALRHEFVFNDANLGILDYLNTFSIFAFAFFQYKLNFCNNLEKKSLSATIYKILFYITVLTYAFLTTGRTSFVFLITIYLVIKGTARKIKKIHITTATVLFLVIFISNALILGKGASTDDTVTDNALSIIDNFTLYFLGGVYALDSVAKSDFVLDYGENVFRFFIAVGHAVGISSLEPKRLVMPYVTTPILSNVYTLYYIYIKDFGYIGVFLASVYSFIHTIFFNITKVRKSFLGIYFFALLMYPLIMSFFQDQYMSLFSTWIQLTFYGIVASFFVTNKADI